MHFGSAAHDCIYCDTGMADQVTLVLNFFNIDKRHGDRANLWRSSPFFEECLPGPILPQDYRAARLIEQGSKLLSKEIVKEIDAVLMLRVIGDDCGNATWVLDAKHGGEGTITLNGPG